MMYEVPINNILAADFIRICKQGSRLRLSRRGYLNVRKGSNAVARLVSENKKIIYGVNTGVGDFCDTAIASDDLTQLQENIILSHACGSAPYLDEAVARGALFLVINSLAKGFSGVTIETIEKLITLFNNGVSPLLPSQGSLGASGDLIPLAHLGLMLLGRGNVYAKGKIRPAGKILERLRISKHVFRPKEALSLINGTAVVTSRAAFITDAADNLILTSCLATAAIFEITGASRSVLDSELHNLKPHPGQKLIAEILRKYLKGSKLCDRPKKKIQDSYVIRCAPQIDGAIFENIRSAKHIVEIEMNSVTDNPLFFTKRGKIKVVSGGNFHAQNLAFALDGLGIAMAAQSKLVERRIERLMNKNHSGLPAFLVSKGGLNSGLMITQYLVASLVAENSVLAHPASIQSIPVSADQEDFVSMAMTSANKAVLILRNCEKALAAEILATAQAMEMSRYFKPGDFSPSIRAFYKKIRNYVPPLHQDRWLSHDLEKITNLIRGGVLTES